MLVETAPAYFHHLTEHGDGIGLPLPPDKVVIVDLIMVSVPIKPLQKRMAYGYRDVAYFLLKVHQHCGLLNPRRCNKIRKTLIISDVFFIKPPQQY